MQDIETNIYTKSDFRIHLDEWDDGGVWLALNNDHARLHTTLTREEALLLMSNLQIVLNKQVTA